MKKYLKDKLYHIDNMVTLTIEEHTVYYALMYKYCMLMTFLIIMLN